MLIDNLAVSCTTYEDALCSFWPTKINSKHHAHSMEKTHTNVLVSALPTSHFLDLGVQGNHCGYFICFL